LTLAPFGWPGSAASAATSTGLSAPAANASPQVEEAASRRCWRQKGKRVCEKVERNGMPSASEPYFDFAPNAVPTARRGWKLDDPVNHPVPSPN
jgi:hypothetical protein